MRHPPLPAPLLWQIYLGIWILGTLAAPWPLPAATCAALIFWGDSRLWRFPRVLLALFCLLAGLLTAQWQLFGAPLRTDFPSLPPEIPRVSTPLCGTVRDIRGLPDTRWRILLEDVRQATWRHGAWSGDGAVLPGLTQLTWDSPTSTLPLPGQNLCIARRVIPAAAFSNVDLPDWRINQAAQGIHWRIWNRGDAGQPCVYGTGTTLARWRASVRQKILLALQSGIDTEQRATLPQGKAIVFALLFGDRYYLHHDTLNHFAAAALAHSLALSGQHLAIAGLIGMLCIGTAARLHPTLYLQMPRLSWILLASLPTALLYLWLGNAPASLVRATCMLAVLTVFILRGRPCTTFDVLCTALLGILAVAPMAVFDTGLQCSVLCVAVLCLSLPWMQPHADPNTTTQRTQRCLHYVVSGLRQIFLTSCIIQVALFPFSVLLFGTMGHLFALNILWVPVVNVFVLPTAALGLICSVLESDTLARLALECAAIPCQWLVDGLAWLSRMGWLDTPAVLRPHWTTLPAYAALLAALAMRMRRTHIPSAARRLALAGILLLCVGPMLRSVERHASTLCLDILDVGQSQAIVLRLPGHIRLLVDGGGSTSQRFDIGRVLTGSALTRNEAPRLAAVLNTHPDLDHMGGLLYVLHHFQVGYLLDNGRSGNGEAGKRWDNARLQFQARPLHRGDILMTDDPSLRLEILHPPPDAFAAWQGNNASVVARLVCHGHGLALLTGDAEIPVLRTLLDHGDDLQADVLVAPHHGSRTGFLREFYEAVQPKLVVASCGLGNRYGFPAKILRSWHTATGIPLLSTARHGEIRITWPKIPSKPFDVFTARQHTQP